MTPAREALMAVAAIAEGWLEEHDDLGTPLDCTVAAMRTALYACGVSTPYTQPRAKDPQ